jgi:hypothetical protein
MAPSPIRPCGTFSHGEGQLAVETPRVKLLARRVDCIAHPVVRACSDSLEARVVSDARPGAKGMIFLASETSAHKQVWVCSHLDDKITH